MGWSIDEGTKTKVVMADRTSSVPLGTVRDIPIKIGKIRLNVPMAVVIGATSYDLILGTDWLE